MVRPPITSFPLEDDSTNLILKKPKSRRGRPPKQPHTQSTRAGDSGDYPTDSEEKLAVQRFVKNSDKNTTFLRDGLGTILEMCGFVGIKSEFEKDKEFTRHCGIMQKKHGQNALLKLMQIEVIFFVELTQHMYKTFDRQAFKAKTNKLMTLKSWADNLKSKTLSKPKPPPTKSTDLL